jgi:hypothetical protein
MNNKRKKAKCPHPYCVGGFVYTKNMVEGKNPGEVMTRSLCPVCNGLAQIRRKR